VEQQPIARATRRTVLAGIAATMAPGQLVAQAQQRDAIRHLGVLMAGSANDPQQQSTAAAFVQGLAALGWREGSNLQIDWRWAGGDPTLDQRYAAELVALGPEVLWAIASPAVAALRRETSTIPIVFTTVTDPVGQGFVESLAHPDGNVTGFSNYDPPMGSKWLGMLTQITPPVARVAVVFDPSTAPYASLMMRTIEDAAPALAVAVRAASVHGDAEIETTMAGRAREERGGLLILPDTFSFLHHDAIVTLAAQHHLPAVYPYREFAVIGGLMSYGIDLLDPSRRSAAYVDHILKGAKPGDLPVQNPTKFELVVNLKTAKALGVSFPTTLLATADEVIE
jgi:putative tryptophan/tyrosine transport system substrate-binding protein